MNTATPTPTATRTEVIDSQLLDQLLQAAAAVWHQDAAADTQIMLWDATLEVLKARGNRQRTR